jgi:hypothetical protein
VTGGAIARRQHTTVAGAGALSDQVGAGWSTENALIQKFGASDPIPSDRDALAIAADRPICSL